MRSLTHVAIAIAFTMAGCTLPQHTQTVDAPQAKGRFIFVQLHAGNGYLIDPRTETCFLRQESGTDYNFAIAPVPCDKLKRGLPEAAAHIPWVAAAPPAGREGPAPAPSPPPPVSPPPPPLPSP